ncbi:Transmembrane protease serine 13 [Halocaridina rubra]|uniref:Transmembrane protease serine 13 n=1 Tax=Halocaridina rubra TaxID=373956 RepID=A0AAN8WXS5_HALRR
MRTKCVMCWLIIVSLVSNSAFFANRKIGHPEFCGIGDLARIIGGTESEAKQWPWMVSLRLFWGLHFCGGFLVTPSHVVTAAHCVALLKEEKALLRVYAGTQGKDANTTVVSQIRTIIIHPKFRRKSAFDSDIAILVLREPLEFDDSISAICLPLREPRMKQNVVAIGYGKTSEKAKFFSPVLRHVNIEVLDPTQCGTYEELVEGTMICAGILQGGKDACSGDSGGPLMSEDEDGIWEAIGIISFGEGCGRPNKPGVYTNIVRYVPWIVKEGLHGQAVRRTRFDRQVFGVMFERVNGVFGCRTRSTNVFDNQIPRSHVRTSLQTLVCRTEFDEPFNRAV